MSAHPPLATPSAKAHERVTGRWNRHIEVDTPRDRFFYYLKHVVGTPAMWFLPLFVFAIFTSRAALEIVTWSFAFFTAVYILADRFSKTKEFIAYRFGSDLALLGLLVTGVIGAVALVPWPETLAAVASLRWIALAYLLIFGLDLFPGVNRLFFMMMAGAAALSLYATFQHFVGVDQIHGGNLEFAPVKEHAYFQAIGLFASPRVLPTLLAMCIPFPAAAYLFAEKRTSAKVRWACLPLICLFSLGLLWTYSPGIWIAALAGVLCLAVLQFKKQFTILGTVAGFLFVVVLVAYNSPAQFIEQLQSREETVSATQREELNKQLTAFSEAPIFGNGIGSPATEKLNRDYGSIYFQLLAESGVLGLVLYFALVLAALLAAYRLLQEIPASHFWHRVIVAGTLGSQIAYHAAGLHWPTLREPHVLYLWVFELAVISYITEHYRRGLVSDDYAL